MLTIEKDLKKLQKNFSEETILYHYPVLYQEVLSYINPSRRKIIVDCTVGVGSHALKIIERMPADSLYIGIDKDKESLEIAEKRIKERGFTNVILIKEDFRNVDSVLKELKIEHPDVFFFDLGISSFQLSSADRGFSFLKEGPLDMRMDRESFLCAYDLVNNLSEKELRKIFELFGEERFSKRIAHFIVERRKKEPIFSTLQLRDIILKAIPYHSRERIHPATRVFQALRIAVNRELDCLQQGLRKAIQLVAQGGVIVVISFHSLEDRIVKHTFKEFAQSKTIKILTKKPITPSSKELTENLSSRSAKLRAAEKL